MPLLLSSFYPNTVIMALVMCSFSTKGWARLVLETDADEEMGRGGGD